MQGPSASSAASPVRITAGRRIWVGVSSAGAFVLGVLPHVLHHVGLFAGALFAGVGGSPLFGAAALAPRSRSSCASIARLASGVFQVRC